MIIFKVGTSAYRTLKSLQLLSEMGENITFNDDDNTISIPEDEELRFEVLLEESLCMEGFEKGQEKLNGRGKDIDEAIAEILFAQDI